MSVSNGVNEQSDRIAELEAELARYKALLDGVKGLAFTGADSPDSWFEANTDDGIDTFMRKKNGDPKQSTEITDSNNRPMSASGKYALKVLLERVADAK